MSATMFVTEALTFVIKHLPDILAKRGPDGVAEAIEDVAAKYRETRDEELKSRAPEIQCQRDAVDAVLAAREAAESKGR